MLHIILVEAAVETIPSQIARHPSVIKDAERRKRKPETILLNRSIHHHAMHGLIENNKRGRPDITQICLLGAMSTPLNKMGELKLWAHTVGGYSIDIASETRLPRDCNRFNSLMEQLFSIGKVPPNEEISLMTVNLISLKELLEKIKPDITIALSSQGRPSNLEKVCGIISNHENSVILIGAFPHGQMRKDTLSLADETISIHHEPLDAWIVVSRLIYEFEKKIFSKQLE